MSFTDEQLIGCYASLLKYAINLTKDVDNANDLVQSTLLKALENRGTYQNRGHLLSWLCAILKHTHISIYRRGKRVVEDVEGVHAAKLVAIGDPESVYAAKELFIRADPDSMVLERALGTGYKELADMHGILVGTVKSRLSRRHEYMRKRCGLGPNDLRRS